MKEPDFMDNDSRNKAIRRQWKKWYLEAMAELSDKKIEVMLLESKVVRLESAIVTMQGRINRAPQD